MKKILPKKFYDEIYSTVPRICIDLLIKNREGKVLLTKRASDFWKGQWHFPGGGVRLKESLNECAIRVAKEELSIDVSPKNFVGLIEYPYEKLSTGEGQSFALVFECEPKSLEIHLDEQATEYNFFSKKGIPENTIPVVKEFLERL